MRNSFSAKRVDTFIQRPRGAVPRSANELDALSHLLHTRGLVARRRSAAGRARQPRRPKLQAAGFVRLAPLLGCSEKSPRQGARASTACLITPGGDPKGDRS